MKKVLVYLAMVVMLCSLAACGEKEKDYDEENVEVEEKSTLTEYLKENFKETQESIEVFENAIEMDINENKETESSDEINENDEVINTYKLYPSNVYTKYNYTINDGLWYFAADIDGEENMKWFCYDIQAGKVMNEIGLEMKPDMRYTSGTSKIKWNVDELGNETLWGAELCNVFTGEPIITLSENQRFIGAWIDEKIFVLEVVETFEKNTYSLGIINNRGEWVYPLSSDYPWLDSSMRLYSVENICNGMTYIGNGIYRIADYLFDVNNNNIREVFKDDDYYIYSLDNGYVYYLSSWDERVFSCNIATGETVELFEGYAVAEDKATYSWDGQEYGLFVRIQGNIVQVKNVRGEIIAEYDMSAYYDWGIMKVTRNRVWFTCCNESGTKYVCLLRADGSLEFEPQKLDDIVSDSWHWYDNVYVDDKKLIIYSLGQCFIFDVDTGKMINEKINYKILEYLQESDMLLVETEHPEYGEYHKIYYLVDTNDLDTLINPFEMKPKTTEQQTEKVEKLSDLDLIKQIIAKYSDGEVFSHVVIKQMSEGIEAFALVEEVFSMNDEGYADIIQSNENYGDEIHRMSGWYINGKKAKQVFFSSDEFEGEGKGYIPTWLNQEEIGVGLCPPLKDGTQLIQVEWSISGHNSGSVFYEIGDNDAIYAFSGSDMMYITEDGSIIVFDYYYDSITETEVSTYWEYVYENKELKLVNSWEEYD